MRRLSVQLALAMLGTMVLTLGVLALTQRWAEWRRFYDLPEEVRLRVPHPKPFLPGGVSSLFFTQPTQGPPGPGGGPYGPGGDGPGFGQVAEGGGSEPGTYNDQLAVSYRAFNRFQNEAFLVGVALAAAMSLALALWLSRLVARPVERVSRAAALLAGGDLTARVSALPAKGMTNLETARLTENFNQMAESLEGYERERKAMIADIAHELRTPLTALSLRLEALQDGLVPLNEIEVASLNRNAALLSRLVEDLRVLSLADAGRLELRRRSTDLARLLTGVFDDYQSRFNAAGVLGALTLPGSGVTVNVDPDRMAQVLGNLLDNALRVTPDGGRITVSAVESAGTVQIAVRDTGPGLSGEAAARAFDRYFQDKDKDYEQPRAGASGLGLAIVKTLVQLHGGAVFARNVEEPTGAEFVVDLPTGRPAE